MTRRTAASAPSREASTGSNAARAVYEAIRDFQTGTDRETSFRYLYERYHPALRAFFSRKGCSPQEAQDLTQETLLGIYRGLEAYRHEDRFEAWLYRAATTTFLKKLRSSATAKRSAVEISQEEILVPRGGLKENAEQLEALITDERRRALSAAVAGLPDQMRRCLALRIYQELSYREIATALRLSVETVKAHLARARRKLQEKLQEGLLAQIEEGDERRSHG